VARAAFGFQYRGRLYYSQTTANHGSLRVDLATNEKSAKRDFSVVLDYQQARSLRLKLVQNARSAPSNTCAAVELLHRAADSFRDAKHIGQLATDSDLDALGRQVSLHRSIS
jgi:hypothetical protein